MERKYRLTSASIRVIINGTVVQDLHANGKLTAGESCYIWMNATGYYHLSKNKAKVNPTSSLPETGKTTTVKIVDVASQQLIADISIRG